MNTRNQDRKSSFAALLDSLILPLAVTLLMHTTAFAADNLTVGWKTLFNGKDLTGWHAPQFSPFWKVVDGVIVGENDSQMKGSLLETDENYADFIVEVEARWEGEIDSGIMLRKPQLQLQMGVSRSLKRDMTCSFYTGGTERYPEAGQAKDLEKTFKSGDWNHYRLQAKGSTFTVWLNGKQVSEYTNAKFSNPAPIGLQVHPGLKMKVEFRNLRVKTLD